ncbi:uncharacterized protein LY79DRAFT_582272 [Colletotrichum navitas]|uniref:Uncharacterized protein n=1 Tax=Colletotrichum navitas TaxID=681940 RepID=A0AAD8PSQ8_9PEZI|nr:uncharacterized protein LY79DRAFT_582272 [Colletotrichum navitas]KAK1579896.1 hypothetical protein LY79DRAFT_582272 [Colletotrichum navitas]
MSLHCEPVLVIACAVSVGLLTKDKRAGNNRMLCLSHPDVVCRRQGRSKWWRVLFESGEGWAVCGPTGCRRDPAVGTASRCSVAPGSGLSDPVAVPVAVPGSDAWRISWDSAEGWEMGAYCFPSTARARRCILKKGDCLGTSPLILLSLSP